MARDLSTALPAMSLAVVGAKYLNRDKSNRWFEMLLCQAGEPVELRPEPKNTHDLHAIAVFSARGVQLGYLTAERAPRIGQLLKQGREIRAIFQQATKNGAWLRVAFDGEAPRLPQPPEAQDTKWYTDEEWSDD